MIDDLELEDRTYAAHKAELLASAEGKFVLIKGERILGVFDTQKEAVHRGYDLVGYESFLTKEILPVDRIYLIYSTAPGE